MVGTNVHEPRDRVRIRRTIRVLKVRVSGGGPGHFDPFPRRRGKTERNGAPAPEPGRVADQTRRLRDGVSLGDKCACICRGIAGLRLLGRRPPPCVPDHLCQRVLCPEEDPELDDGSYDKQQDGNHQSELDERLAARAATSPEYCRHTSLTDAPLAGPPKHRLRFEIDTIDLGARRTLAGQYLWLTLAAQPCGSACRPRPAKELTLGLVPRGTVNERPGSSGNWVSLGTVDDAWVSRVGLAPVPLVTTRCPLWAMHARTVSRQPERVDPDDR
jgi:hypothetical protein